MRKIVWMSVKDMVGTPEEAVAHDLAKTCGGELVKWGGSSLAIIGDTQAEMIIKILQIKANKALKWLTANQIGKLAELELAGFKEDEQLSVSCASLVVVKDELAWIFGSKGEFESIRVDQLKAMAISAAYQDWDQKP